MTNLREERSISACSLFRAAIERSSSIAPDQINAPLPVVYFHDGTLMIERGRVPNILDNLFTSGKVRPFVAVFVDPVSRVDDYSADPAFREWFIETLVPQIEGTLPAAPTARAVVGVSRGAAAALDLAWHHPELFGRCGLLIPSTSPTGVTRQIDRAEAKPIVFSMITGRYDVEWLREGQALREVLARKGYQLAHREVPEGHNVQTWRAHLDDVLIGLGLGPDAPQRPDATGTYQLVPPGPWYAVPGTSFTEAAAASAPRYATGSRPSSIPTGWPGRRTQRSHQLRPAGCCISPA